jgi:hypothetical protein
MGKKYNPAARRHRLARISTPTIAHERKFFIIILHKRSSVGNFFRVPRPPSLAKYLGDGGEELGAITGEEIPWSAFLDLRPDQFNMTEKVESADQSL